MKQSIRGVVFGLFILQTVSCTSTDSKQSGEPVVSNVNETPIELEGGTKELSDAPVTTPNESAPTAPKVVAAKPAVFYINSKTAKVYKDANGSSEVLRELSKGDRITGAYAEGKSYVLLTGGGYVAASDVANKPVGRGKSKATGWGQKQGKKDKAITTEEKK